MRRHLVAVVLSMLFLGIIAYSPSFSAQLFWDDDDFILNNTYVVQANWQKFFTAQAVEGAGKVSNYFRPVQFSLYTLLYQLFGPNTFVYHAASIITHIGASLALYWFIKRLTSKYILAWIVSLFFLLHPIQTEAVSYASGISDPLQALFGFCSLSLFLLYKQKNQNKILFYLASFCCFIMAILSKESGIIFLGILGLLIFIPRNAEIVNLKTLYHLSLPLFPFLLASISYLYFHTRFIDVVDMASIWSNIPYTHSTILRLAQFTAILPTYISLLIAPIQLFYERDFTLNLLSNVWDLPVFITSTLILAIGTLTTLWHFKKPTQLSYLRLFAFFTFFVSLLPYSGIILINGIMYEHFLYVPMVFFFLLISTWISNFKLLVTHKYIAIFVLLIIVIVYIGRSWIRQIEWQDPIRFYSQTLSFAPKSFRVLNNLGMTYANIGQHQEAIDTYNKAILLNPTIPNPYHNIANVYLKQNDLKAAEEYFLKAISVDSFFGYSYSSLLNLYMQTGQVEKQNKIKEDISRNFKNP